jgi:dihydrofolate reductase
MRKLKLQVQLSLDGLIAGPNGEMMDFEWNWDDKLKEYVDGITQPIDTILLGRKLAEGFIPYWAEIAEDPTHPEHAAGIKFTQTPKVVFSRTLTTSPWERTQIANGELEAEIHSLKQAPGGDIMVYGGGQFVSALIASSLIDEYHLFVNPVAFGQGISIFQALPQFQKLELENSIAFECGIVLLKYTIKD